MASYTYKVFRAVDPAEVEIDGYQPLADGSFFQLVGEFRAKEPGLAALAAAEQVGQPGVYHPVPDRHFNSTPIVPTTGFMIGEPEDPAPGGEGGGDDEGVTSVSDLADGLDPEHACESEDCGHLPMLHGAKGLGLCRIDDCPCGGYTPAP